VSRLIGSLGACLVEHEIGLWILSASSSYAESDAGRPNPNLVRFKCWRSCAPYLRGSRSRRIG
jgi:hypothetical protein